MLLIILAVLQRLAVIITSHMRRGWGDAPNLELLIWQSVLSADSGAQYLSPALLNYIWQGRMSLEMYSFMTKPQAFLAHDRRKTKKCMILLHCDSLWETFRFNLLTNLLIVGLGICIMSKLQLTHKLGKVHGYFVDDRGKQTQQLVQVWWRLVQLDVTMWCSVNQHNQLPLLCHYVWQGWGTAVASEPHLLGCLCV